MKMSPDDVYAASVRTPIHEITQILMDSLGPTLTSILAGSRHRNSAHRWARRDGPVPRPETEARLRVAYRAFTLIASNESPDIARVWLTGSNPSLGENTAITAIGADLHQQVIGAATAFVEGT